jgi:hypothetical protein
VAGQTRRVRNEGRWRKEEGGRKKMEEREKERECVWVYVGGKRD